MEVHIVTPLGGRLSNTIEVYPFTEENVMRIPEEAQFGNYRIGLLKNDEFWVQYFGRSDHNDGGLRKRVSDHLTMGATTDHKNRLYDESYYFWFKVQSNELEAFRQECRDWHTFKDLDEGNFVDNDIHPARPNGRSCPICNE